MELIFNDSYETMQCSIYVRDKSGCDTVILGYDGKELVHQILPKNHIRRDIKPLFIIPIHMKDELIKAFINEGAKANLRTDNENMLKGKLEAVELHLQDMREISQKLLDNKLLPVEGFKQ